MLQSVVLILLGRVVMQLALILFRYFPFGGLQRDFLRIANALHEQGYQLNVYTMRWQGEKPTFLTIHELATRAWTNHGRCLQFAERVQFLLSQQSYAGVIGFNKMPGLTVYFAADDCFKAKAIEEKSWWYRLTSRYRCFQQLEAAIFSPGNQTHILLLNQRQAYRFIYYYNTEPNRLTVLPPSIGQDLRTIPIANEAANISWIPRTSRGTLLFPTSRSFCVILMVASHFHTKGVDRALHAIAALHREEVILSIAGDDNPARYTRLLKKLHLEHQVTFLGPRHDILDLMKSADVLLHPARQEAAGYVLLEALSVGLPVITTAICGYAEYITKAQSGIVLPQPFSQSDLNQAVATLLNKATRQRYHQHAMKYLPQLNLQQMLPTAINTINQIIKGQASIEDIHLSGTSTKKCADVPNRWMSLIYPLLMKMRISPGSRGQAAGSREQRRPAACPRDPGIRSYKQKTAASFPLGIDALIAGPRNWWMSSIDLLPNLPAGDSFEVLLHYQGISHRALENRKTIEVYIGGQHYFIKQHYGVGWREIIKNLLQGRLPIIGAKNEWRALQLLPTLGIPTMSLVAYGSQGRSPATQQSFIVTRALENTISLEDLCATWPKNPPLYATRVTIIKEVARMARALHGAKIYHRDFYICHFLLAMNHEPLRLYLIDLHRALIKKSVSQRWLIKDLAGLYFSSMDCGITTKDICRFLRDYYQQPLRLILTRESRVLKAIDKRAKALYAKHHEKPKKT